MVAAADTITLLSQRWHVFQVVYDGHQPGIQGDFTSVEQTVDGDLLPEKPRHHNWTEHMAAPWVVTCLTRMLALEKCPSAEPSSTAGSSHISCPYPVRKAALWRDIVSFKMADETARILKRPFRRNSSPRREFDPKEVRRHEAYLKTFSDRTIRNVFGLPTTSCTLPKRSAKSVRKSPTGTATMKRRIAGRISGSSSAIFLRRASMAASQDGFMRSW